MRAVRTWVAAGEWCEGVVERQCGRGMAVCIGCLLVEASPADVGGGLCAWGLALQVQRLGLVTPMQMMRDWEAAHAAVGVRKVGGWPFRLLADCYPPTHRPTHPPTHSPTTHALQLRPLEVFFPYDPYLLPRSARLMDLRGSYVRWRRGGPCTAAEEEAGAGAVEGASDTGGWGWCGVGSWGSILATGGGVRRGGKGGGGSRVWDG